MRRWLGIDLSGRRRVRIEKSVAPQMVDEIAVAAGEVFLRDGGEMRARAAFAQANAGRNSALPSRAIGDGPFLDRRGPRRRADLPIVERPA
jgi:hypothetical protein